MSELKTLEQVLQDKLLTIGDYQRPYAWDEKQLEDLWTDIDLLGSHPHYTGTLVLQGTPKTATTRSGQTLHEHFVVDGQQRLTTCVILLERLSRALKQLQSDETDEAADEIGRLVHVNIEGVRQPRLRLSADLNRFFADGVLGDDAFEGSNMQAAHSRLAFAATFFEMRIAGLISGVVTSEAIARLLRLRTRACYQLQFMVYNVSRSDEVGVLFETVNGRGKNLTELERVKNYLLYLGRQLSDAQRESIAERINESWSAIFTSLGRVALREDSLLRAHWLVTQDANQRNWRGAESIKSKFPRSDFVDGSSRLVGDVSEEVPDKKALETTGDVLFETLKNYVDSLRKSAAFLADVQYAGATYPDFGAESTVIREKTAALRRSGSVASFYPLLIAARLSHPKDADLYSRVVDFCERFAARVWAIGGLRSNAGESSIRWAARDLYNGASPKDLLARLEARLWQLAPDDAVLAAFNPTVQWYPRSTAHKFILYEYELSMQRDSAELPHFGDITAKGSKTTEHVLPQNPEDGSQWWVDFSMKEHADLVHSIGNLVLTKDNSRYGRRDYRDSPDASRPGKRGAPGQKSPHCFFSASNLVRERELAATYEEWTPRSIADRARNIGEWALERWPAASPAVAQVDMDDERIQEDEDLIEGGH